jgi:hypothetical protein
MVTNTLSLCVRTVEDSVVNDTLKNDPVLEWLEAALMAIVFRLGMVCVGRETLLLI